MYPDEKDFITSKNCNNDFLKYMLHLPLWQQRRNETKVSEEYCWVVPQVEGWWSCGWVLALWVLKILQWQNSLTCSRADSHVKMWRFTDVLQTETATPLSGCCWWLGRTKTDDEVCCPIVIHTTQGRTPSHQFWFYQATCNTLKMGMESVPKTSEIYQYVS